MGIDELLMSPCKEFICTDHKLYCHVGVDSHADR